MAKKKASTTNGVNTTFSPGLASALQKKQHALSAELGFRVKVAPLVRRLLCDALKLPYEGNL